MFILCIFLINLGAKYLNECSQQNYIPVFLIVGGVFGIIIFLLSCLTYIIGFLCLILNCLAIAFSICWFITGSVWIYTIYPPNYNSTVADVPYCDKTLYQFAFWITTLAYVVLAIAFLKICCLAIILKIKMGKRVSTEETGN
ncbi:transmembrane protein 272-like [Trichomycterus rosablanca]|uniref:transmembrane protein 272-like n=1 Tax=Trichomycterus rosablanca TaxID=2290929 RepID=UPI002F3563E6